MNNNQNSEFINLQFIRNPAVETCCDNLKYVAFDYFDYIFVKKVKTFSQCMSTENEFSCEAYQNLSIFKTDILDDNSDYLGSPFENSINKDKPFLSIMQITITPETFNKFDSEFGYEHLGSCEKELNDCINYVISQVKNQLKNDQELKLKYRIYKSVNTMDYCIAISCNMLEFSLYLSNKINSIIFKDKAKYVVYTVMGVDKSFSSNIKVIINNSILVTRIRLNRNLWGNDVAWSELLSKLEKGCNETHTLIGRYDLSIRVIGYDNIVFTLENLIKYKENGNKNTDKKDRCNIKPYCYDENETNIDKTKKPNSADLITWLLNNNYADYINERILFDKILLPMKVTTSSIFKKEQSTSKELNKLLICYKKIQKKIEQYPIKEDIQEYMKKLKNMIHICIGLYSTYDTQINVIMFKKYLVSFMELFKLSLDIYSTNIFEDWINIKLNFIEGLNYLQQFIKIVTSINGNSFQSPKYDIVQQECSIEKFPIAYSEFMSEMCNIYYNYRKKLNDSEFEYYPRYRVLMIPFMTSMPSDFTMTILFSQGISHDWNTEKIKWKKWINSKSYSVPIFVTCQNLKTYLDVSGVIVAAFHELGHYCNSLERKIRNRTIIEIAASIASKCIVKAYSYCSSVLMPIQMKMLRSNSQFSEFNEIVYNALLSKLKDCMKEDLDSPNILFMEKLTALIHDILKPVPPYHTEIDLQKKYMNYLTDDLKFRYQIDILFPNDTYTNESHKIFLRQAYEKLYVIVSEKISNLRIDAQTNEFVITDELENFLSNILKFSEIAKDNIDSFIFAEDSLIDELYKDIVDGYNSIINNNTYSDTILIVVEELRDIIKYILKSCEDFTIIFVNDRDQTLINEDVVKNKTKSKVIDDIMSNIPSVIRRKEYFYEVLAADLNNKLFFRSEETLENLKIVLYDSFMKTDFNEDELDVWQISYTESLSDIVMCLNLNLDIVEYLIFMSHIYCEYDSSLLEKIRRIIIVTSFLYINNESNKDKNIEKYDNFSTKFIEYLYSVNEIKGIISKSKCKDRLTQCEKNILQLYNVINENLFIVNNATYRIILSSLLQNCSCVKFLNDEQINNLKFVKKYLKNKLLEDSFDKDIEMKEIDFILKYYYKTRTKYKNLD